MFKKIRLFLTTISLISLSLAASTSLVLADTNSDLGLPSTTAGTLGQTVISKAVGPVKIVGGILIFISVVTVILGLIVANKKPEQRAMIMSAVPWIAGCGAALGMITIIAGFFIGL